MSRLSNQKSWRGFHGHLVALVSQHALGSDSRLRLVWLEPQTQQWVGGRKRGRLGIHALPSGVTHVGTHGDTSRSPLRSTP